MKRAGLLPILILAWPILEIAGLIWVGQRLGLLSTLALLIGVGIVGVMLVRFEGLRVLGAVQSDMRAGRVPAEKLVQGALIAVAGLLFVLPGFLTDIIAILLLLPPTRKIIARLLMANMTVVTSAATRRSRPGVVDLDPDEYRHSEGGEGQAPRLGRDQDIR